MKIEILNIIKSDIFKEVADILIKQNKKITFAESCTGGLLAKEITDISGVSECFECSFVTYSNEKKQKLLNVSEKTLESFGAVSHQTAYEMCIGAKNAADADIAIGVTGIAGPTGGTDEKPVGLVYVGLCSDDYHAVCKLNLSGDRETVRKKTSICAYYIAKRALENKLPLCETNSQIIEIEFI